VSTPSPAADPAPSAASAVRWQVLPDTAAVAQAAAQYVLTAAATAIAASGRFRIVLAGGRTPAQTYRLLATAPAHWPAWEIYFGDERCLPLSHPERNSTLAQTLWLAHVAIPSAQIHPIPAEWGPELAAARYAVVIERALPFDLVLLGLGEDGHTASLFPGHPYPDGDWVHAVRDAPKPPPGRVSLSARALGQARGVLVLACGAEKREAVRRWRAGDELPIARIRGINGLDVLLDAPAHAG
jgi:6-phosphogluconolactonase